MSKAAILSLAAVAPTLSVPQSEIAEALIRQMPISSIQAEKLKKVFLQSGVEKRHLAFEHFREGKLTGIYSEPFPHVLPGTKERNRLYMKGAPVLALQSAREALTKWGRPANEITHVISISCTGFMAPGIEFILLEPLGISKSVHRTGINFMGCFGAFQGLNAAKAFCSENRKNRVLVVCTELCSLHFQGEITPETIISNCLFADGSAAVVMGSEPHHDEHPLWYVEKCASIAMEDSMEEMTWEPGNDGYIMRLSSRVPIQLKESVASFVESLTQDKDIDWLIHPGGKAILKGIEEALNVRADHSWEVMRQFGNMSSATFLFVLEKALQANKIKDKGVGLAFGPGLSMEGVLLSRA